MSRLGSIKAWTRLALEVRVAPSLASISALSCLKSHADSGARSQYACWGSTVRKGAGKSTQSVSGSPSLVTTHSKSAKYASMLSVTHLFLGLLESLQGVIAHNSDILKPFSLLALPSVDRPFVQSAKLFISCYALTAYTRTYVLITAVFVQDSNTPCLFY